MFSGSVRSNKPASQQSSGRWSGMPGRQLFTPLWLGLLLLVFAALLIAGYGVRSEHKTARAATNLVQRQSFSLQVHERGIVRPARVVPIKSKISSNRAKVVWLHDEGKQVTKGLSSLNLIPNLLLMHWKTRSRASPMPTRGCLARKRRFSCKTKTTRRSWKLPDENSRSQISKPRIYATEPGNWNVENCSSRSNRRSVPTRSVRAK